MSQRASSKQEKPRSRRAARDEPSRGSAEETRKRLLDAALDAFGRFGFDGASTRSIAAAAGVNLAAIPYHFGGKQGLHRAVAQHIVDEVRGQVGPFVDTVGAALGRGEVGPSEAHAMLQAFARQATEVLLGHPEAQRWAPFILREQMDPSPTFDVLYDGFMGRAHTVVTALLARATGRPADAPETIARATALFGQLVIFRLGRALIERRLGWKGYGPDEIAMVQTIVRDNLDAIVEAGRR
jgi:AcrR family transcriptional regulator